MYCNIFFIVDINNNMRYPVFSVIIYTYLFFFYIKYKKQIPYFLIRNEMKFISKLMLSCRNILKEKRIDDTNPL